MPRLRLTVKSVAALLAPTASGKTELHWDDGDGAVRGFGVQCSGSASTKSFVVQRDTNGRTHRYNLGGVNELSLKEARTKAGDYLQAMRQGKDPELRSTTPS